MAVSVSMAFLLYDPQAHARERTAACVARAVTHGAELPDAVRRCEALVAWQEGRR
ncbi:hypothetical protein M0638_27885 [Roseomonas sp. NAR14]|uniref:Uncharacterized protein n=1 Tax=Roseomonas acroporae TaxID=2937791 RepID=A0A9X2BZP7_9PROT|nr:hypothetical protein [Roseomonas acroporae]MCK8788174.1 hypothetical protein [Roseomonas acroporae]